MFPDEMLKDLGVNSQEELLEKLKEHDAKMKSEYSKIDNIQIMDENDNLHTLSNPQVKYPDIEVQLTGINGNAFNIIGVCQGAMRRAKCTQEQMKEFVDEAMAGDYDHVLQTCLKYFDVS
jgi:hypothetical protein